MSTIVELRQYTLHPGQTDVLVELFEREFVESQEALGMRVLGTFHDLDRTDRFVWFRGFDGMVARAEALKAFYDGPVWQAHRNAANATMVDSDNVLLLRVARPGSGFAAAAKPRAPRGAVQIPPGLVAATIYYFDEAVPPAFPDFFEQVARPALDSAGLPVNATYLSETSPNNYPRLPVREADRVFVWLSILRDAAEYERALARLARSDDWQQISARLRRQLKAEPEVLRLQPTPRSELHG